jgi:hypothetical protein
MSGLADLTAAVPCAAKKPNILRNSVDRARSVTGLPIRLPIHRERIGKRNKMGGFFPVPLSFSSRLASQPPTLRKLLMGGWEVKERQWDREEKEKDRTRGGNDADDSAG